MKIYDYKGVLNMKKYTKQCTKCNKLYEVNTEEELTKHFYKSGKNDGKLRTVCKDCFNSNSRKATSSKDNGIIADSNGVFIKKCTKCDTIYKSDTIDGFSESFSYLNKDSKVLNNICKHCKNKAHYNKYTLEELTELQIKLNKKLRLINEVISEKQTTK